MAKFNEAPKHAAMELLKPFTMVHAFTLFLLCWSCVLGSAANAQPLSILIIAFPAAGHVTPAANLGEELVRRGHKVTLCTTDTEGTSLPKEKADAAGMTYLSAGNSSFTLAQFQRAIQTSELENQSVSTAAGAGHTKIMSWFPDIANAIGKALDHVNLTDYNIIISTEFLAPVTACISRKWNVPAIILSTNFQYQPEHLPPWPFPPPFLNKVGSLLMTDNLDFVQRLLSVLFKPLFYVVYDYIFVRNIVNRFEFECPNSSYSFIRYFTGTNAPQIVPTAIGFEYPRLISSLTHYVGPVLSKQPQDIPKDLQEWLDSKPERSVLLVSMGSLASLTRKRGQVIIESVLSTNLSVVWSLRESNQFILDGLEIDKERFYISKWIPQAAILKHPVTAMAFLHGGMNGINEAISCGVPMIVMPFSADQEDLCARVHHSGAGIQILKYYLTEETLTAAIKDIQEGKNGSFYK